MNSFPCPTFINCDHSDIPLAGFNTEAPDSSTFICIQYGQTYNQPRMDWNWQVPYVPATYQSLISQADACANAQALEIQNLVGCGTSTNDTGCWTDENGNQIPTYGNLAVTFPVLCPDGLVFDYTIPAGRYFALDPTTANAIAASFAQNLAYSNQICLSSLPPGNLCRNQQVYLPITATSANTPITFSIVSGTLPPGLILNQISPNTTLIEGLAGTSGTYPFTLMAVDTLGNFMLKSYTMIVLGTLTGSSPLPTGVTGINYNFNLGAAGGTPPYTFTQVGGSFPPSVAMNAQGVIAGIPGLGMSSDVSGNYVADAQIADSVGNSCIEAVPITIVGPNWKGVNWQAPVYVPNDGKMSISTGPPDTMVAVLTPDPTPGAHGTIVGTMSYAGPPSACSAQVSLTVLSGSPSCTVTIQVNNLFVFSQAYASSQTSNFRLNLSPGIIKVTVTFQDNTTNDSMDAIVRFFNTGP